MKWFKKHVSTIILVIVFLIGLSLLLYPSVSDYWNSFHQSRIISSYTEHVTEMEHSDYEEMWKEAVEYNQKFTDRAGHWKLSEKEKEEYESKLNIGGTGVMGYIEIPSIDCTLPLYHGTNEGVLQIAVGHLEGSSLPVGGEGTHCVLSSHRGLPSAKLFTDLDQMQVGDLFMLHILDETLTYEVDQILIVLPDEMDALEIEEGKDLCTLVTCTPYGVNTHRLLVRGHRVENIEERHIRVISEARQIEPLAIAPVFAVPLLVLLLIWLLFHTRKKKVRGEVHEK